MSIPSQRLNDGHDIPAVGFGTAGLLEDDGYRAVRSAIDVGYRMIDTAMRYENEEPVGRAIRDAVAAGDVTRDEITLISKLPGRDHGYDQTLASIDGSLQRLGLDRIDMYLIHWPLPRLNEYVNSFKAMLNAREAGKIRSVGVCNFTPKNLRRLIDETGVTPAVNQIQVTPDLPRADWRELHRELGIITEAWSPLGGLHGLGEDTRELFTEIAQAHDVSFGQAMLRWHTQQDTVPIVKSGSAERQRENLDVFGFDLTERDFERAKHLAKPVHPEWDPETHEEF